MQTSQQQQPPQLPQAGAAAAPQPGQAATGTSGVAFPQQKQQQPPPQQQYPPQQPVAAAPAMPQQPPPQQPQQQQQPQLLGRPIAQPSQPAAPQQAQQAQPGVATGQQPAPQLAQPQQQQQQLQQQHFPHQGLNGGWQSDKDYQERRKMIAKIVHLLQQRKPNAPQEWLKKLPQMAKRLEESLYRSAKSFEEYNDTNTLKHRLQQLAVNIGMKTKKMQHQQALQRQQRLSATQPQVQQSQAAAFRQPSTQSQPLVQPQTAQQPAQPPAAPVAPAPPAQQSTAQRMVNLSEINPIIGAPAPTPASQPAIATAAAPATAAAATSVPVQQVQYSQPSTANGGASQQQQPLTATAKGPAPTSGTNGRSMSDRQQVLRHQQQRLLLLRHAAKCQHEDGRCPVTPHCAGMKRLWKHIAECKNQKCLVPHCVSSRYVLSHYHRCKDVRCPVCGPVREAIHRSHEKQKQMQALKQRHQQAVQQTKLQGTASAAGVASTTGVAAVAAKSGAASGALTQPLQPSSAIEPPTKRQKSSAVPPAPGLAPVQRALPQPAASRQGIPTQPAAARPGFAYGQRPQVASVPGLAFANGQVITPKHSGPKPQEDHTLINCFSVDQIETHIASLSQGLQLPPQKLKAKCLDVLKVLQSHQHAWVFNTPVDPVELGLPDYFEVIKKPMDLGTIRKRLENGVYHSLYDFRDHVNLTFDNAMTYNPEGSVVYNMAKEMKTKFEHDFKKLLQQLEAEEDIKRRNGEACSLCGCEKLLFEPPVFYCNGMNCPSKRIRRNGYYYVGGNNQYHWCQQCFQELRDGSTIDLGDVQIRKESLIKKKNDEVHEESWVQCDRCERWVHQICALFNTRQNKDQRSEYACPRCTIEERKKKEDLGAKTSTPMAEDLPRTKLSEYLEEHVRNKVNEYVENAAREKAQVEGISIDEAKKKVQMGGAITIRQVTSMDRKLEVRERMKKRYAFKNYPDEFSFRCKCIIVFQNLDGVDVILFGLYVYEHDEKNPAPNKRAVYISYLDSVHYMRPRQMRTFIYHEILISYLDYVRKRGFATAHIWACPPLKGDDYILYAKPEDQKTPRDDRLRQWYVDMLVESQRRGIVGKVTNMYDIYFSNPKNDASIVPYMDGDYFPAEVENIIKDLEEGKSGKKGSSQGKKKDKKAKQKKKSGRGGTRSTGLDEDALKASGFIPPGGDSKPLEEGGRDYVMVKLGETIHPMKESFIVAFLAWKGAKEEDMVVPKEIAEYREKHNITWKLPDNNREDMTTETSDAKKEKEIAEPESKKEESSPSDPAANASESKTESGQVEPEKSSAGESQEATNNNAAVQSGPSQGESQGEAKPGVAANPGSAEDDKPEEGTAPASALPMASPSTEGKSDMETQPRPMEGVKKDSSSGNEGAGEKTTANTSNTTVGGEEKKDAEPTGETRMDASSVDPSSATSAQSANASVREGKFAAMAARKRDLEGNLKKEEKKDKDVKKEDVKEDKSIMVKDSKGRSVKVLDDDEEELDCEFLNNRQAFLNLCQGNHYQFDWLRRAKHSSMMVLWHLHNRDAPKFVQQCATCSREILSGFRFHCPTCADFDQCQECVHSPKIVRHPHPLKPIPVATGQQSELTEAQRRERQRSIQLHMTLLLHAATCNNPKCPSANCTKMKGLLKHGAQCQIKATGGCNVCKRIWALLQLHARQCKAKSCPVPNCMAIRERVRQLKKQQQAMDDRRRQEMNRAYRGKR